MANDSAMRTRPSRAYGLSAAVLSISIAISLFAVHSSGATSQKRPDLHVAANGSDAGACTAAAPCRTFAAAYEKAHSGQQIVVAGGRYGEQAIPYDSTKGADPVTFRPATGAHVDLSWDPVTRTGGLAISGAHIVVDGTETRGDIDEGRRVGFDIGSVVVRPDSEGSTPHQAVDVTIRDVNMSTIEVVGSRDVTVSGGQIGPFRTCLFAPNGNPPDLCQDQNMMMGEDGGDFGATQIDGVTYNLSNLTLAGIVTHDVSKPKPGPQCQANPASCAAHTDCWQFGSGRQITIRDNVFQRCSDSDFFTGYQSGFGFADWLVERNYFGMITPPSGVAYYNFQMSNAGADGRTCPGVVIRGNVIEGAGFTLGCSPSSEASRARVVANVLASTSRNTCETADYTSSLNLYYEPGGPRCNATETVVGRRILKDLAFNRVLTALRSDGFSCAQPLTASDGTRFASCQSTVRTVRYAVTAVGADGGVRALHLTAVSRPNTTADSIDPAMLRSVAGVAFRFPTHTSAGDWARVGKSLTRTGHFGRAGIALRFAHDRNVAVLDVEAS